MASLAEQTLEERVAAATADWQPSEWSPDWRPLRVAMSFDEFLDAATLPHNRFEYVDGEAVEMPGVDLLHSRLHGWLFLLLGTWIRRRRLGEVFLAGYTQPTEGRRHGREPDILFVRADNLGILGERALLGACDLAVEIVSPGSGRIDRKFKFREYARAGIGEYWILDPHRRLAQFFVLHDGAYEPAEGEEEAYACRAIAGVTLEPAWFWEQPALDDILAQWDAAAGPA